MPLDQNVIGKQLPPVSQAVAGIYAAANEVMKELIARSL